MLSRKPFVLDDVRIEPLTNVRECPSVISVILSVIDRVRIVRRIFRRIKNLIANRRLITAYRKITLIHVLFIANRPCQTCALVCSEHNFFADVEIGQQL